MAITGHYVEWRAPGGEALGVQDLAIERVEPGTWAVWRQRQARAGAPVDQLKAEHLVSRVWGAEGS